MKKNNTTHPDKTDKQIIKKLQTNARKPYRQIAKELNLSVGTIIELHTTDNIDKIINKYHNNITTTHKTTGQYNTLLITRFKNITQLNTFLQTLTQDKNINKTNIQLILETKNN